ncbi:hypothetical protein MRX96_014412 [Rhipicephalus microplus]
MHGRGPATRHRSVAHGAALLHGGFLLARRKRAVAARRRKGCRFPEKESERTVVTGRGSAAEEEAARDEPGRRWAPSSPSGGPSPRAHATGRTDLSDAVGACVFGLFLLSI